MARETRSLARAVALELLRRFPQPTMIRRRFVAVTGRANTPAGHPAVFDARYIATGPTAARTRPPPPSLRRRFRRRPRRRSSSVRRSAWLLLLVTPDRHTRVRAPSTSLFTPRARISAASGATTRFATLHYTHLDKSSALTKRTQLQLDRSLLVKGAPIRRRFD